MRWVPAKKNSQEFIDKFDDIIMMQSAEQCDKDIKDMLIALQPKYDELTSIAVSLKSLLSALKKNQ